MATKKTAVSQLDGEAKQHFNKVWSAHSEKLHGVNHKFVVRRTDSAGNVDYILFNYGTVRTKQGVQNRYEPMSSSFKFEKVGDIKQEKEWFAQYCLDLFGKPTPNA